VIGTAHAQWAGSKPLQRREAMAKGIVDRPEHGIYAACVTAFVIGICLMGCASSPRYSGSKHAREGVASYYAHKFHGRTTASGEIYDMHKMTCAHRELPFGTRVKVTNLSNKKSVILRVNDRGPFVKGRIIDVSYEAAKRLDFLKAGVVRVGVEVLK
jgi:rare lipoprotein A